MDGAPCHSISLLKPTFSQEYCRLSLKVLQTALYEVPAYQSWLDLDPGSGYPIDIRYASMPALTKSDIRNHFPGGLVPKGKDIKSGLANGEIEFVETSGTVDDKVTNIWNQKWWDCSEKASWKLNSYSLEIATGLHREAILASPLNVGFASDDKPLPIEKRRLSRFLFLNEKTSISSWTPKHMDRIIDDLETFKPVVLEANPSLLAKLCRFASASKENVFQPRLIVFTYEYPTKIHYRQIREVFQKVPIASSYGTTETGYVFMQCEKGKFHQNTEFCRVDFQPLKPEHGGPFLGRILVTTFNNPWYYLLRFNVGDLVRLDDEGKCSCGRNTGIVISAIEGRITNSTLTCDGRLVTASELDENLSQLDNLDEYKLLQTSRGSYDLSLVSKQEVREELQEKARYLLTRLYGKRSRIHVLFKKKIIPESSGKYRISGTTFQLNIEDYLDSNCITEGKHS